MYKEACIDIRALKKFHRKKVVTPHRKRDAVEYLLSEPELSNRKACKMISISRTACQYKAKTKDDSPLQDALTALTTKHVSIGFWQCYYRIWNRGHRWNHKKVYRVYIQMKLNIRRRSKKRLHERVRQALTKHSAPNQVRHYRLRPLLLILERNSPVVV